MLEDLFRRVAEGSEEAFEALYRELRPQLFPMLRRMLGTPEEAEEVFHDALLKLRAAAAGFDPEKARAATYARVIARNLALSRLRARRARPQRLEPDVHRLPSAAAADPPPIEDRVRVRRALARLDPLERRLLEAAFYQGYSHRELAEAFGLPLGTAKSKLRRALRKLRDHLEEP